MENGYTCNFPTNNVEDYEMTAYRSVIIPKKCPLLKHIAIVLIKNESHEKSSN